MTRYRSLWWRLVCALTLIGFVLAGVLLTMGAVIWVALGSGLGLTVLRSAYAEAGAAPALRSPIQVLVLRGVFAALIGTAIVGLIAACGGSALLLVLVIATGSPDLLDRLRAATAWPSRDGGPPSPSCSAAIVSCRTLSDKELCLRWQSTFVGLQAPISVASRLDLTNARQELLDELAERDPAGLTRWLDSGALAAGSPHQYLTSERSQPPA